MIDPMVSQLAHASSRRWTVGLGMAVSAGLTLVGLVASLLVLQFLRAPDYPGALKMSNHNLFGVLPAPNFRHDASYRTDDLFPVVYNWYSNGFRLGPEVRALSACILLADASRWLVFERHVSVTLCDTPTGRMIFVMRSVALRYRW